MRTSEKSNRGFSTPKKKVWHVSGGKNAVMITTIFSRYWFVPIHWPASDPHEPAVVAASRDGSAAARTNACDCAVSAAATNADALWCAEAEEDDDDEGEEAFATADWDFAADALLALPPFGDPNDGEPISDDDDDAVATTAGANPACASEKPALSSSSLSSFSRMPRGLSACRSERRRGAS